MKGGARPFRLEDLLIPPELSLADAMSRLDQAGSGALVICDESRHLIALLTDGDIRRALLRGVDLGTPCVQVANRNPLLGQAGLSPQESLQIMMQRQVDHLPLVDAQGRLVELRLRKLLVADEGASGSADWLDRVIIHPGRTLSEAISQLNDAGTGALVVSSGNRRLDGLLTDGDIRRAVLQGRSLDSPCGECAVRSPFAARYPVSNAQALKLMLERDINHLPVVDDDNVLLDLLLRRDLSRDEKPGLSAVIMAGGFGKRLMPLTRQVPKPMLPVGDKPLLERTIDRLRSAGVRNVHLTTHYLPENIREHFGSGEKFGVRIDYAQEDDPLGTAGGLRLLPRPDTPFVVINGDILTGVSFDEMLQFHKRHGALLTVGVRKYEVNVPFGVVECDDVVITGLKEKPSLGFFINAGIYLLEPAAYDLIPEGQFFNMTDLIDKALREGGKVVSFPIIEYWLDIGRHEDYQKAQEDVVGGKLK